MQTLDISIGKRAENISVEEYVRVANFVYDRQQQQSQQDNKVKINNGDLYSR